MRCVSVDSNLRLFYKTNNLESGQNVIFNIWDQNGSIIKSNESATEIGTEGVYYYDFVTPILDCYLLIVGSNNGNFKEPEIIKSGNPSEKSFYVQGSLRSGKIIGYQIYDESNVILASGPLNDIVSGFYSADVTGLSEPWFFEVVPLVSINQACFSPE